MAADVEREFVDMIDAIRGSRVSAARLIVRACRDIAKANDVPEGKWRIFADTYAANRLAIAYGVADIREAMVASLKRFAAVAGQKIDGRK